MDFIEIFESFQTQEQAIEHLEERRWGGRPVCPYCGSKSVCRHASGDRSVIRWQCQGCTRAFSVTVGTIFHATHVSLRSWFLLLGLMLNSNEAPSASQIARDLGMRRATVSSMMRRVRTALANDPEQAKFLYKIVQGDDAHVDRKPRKRPPSVSGARSTKTSISGSRS